jgi:long-chain fatty acid transport protein
VRYTNRSKSTTIAVSAALALCSLPGWSAGFAVQETSASGLGNAYAGGAAAAADASTVWTNPAGMSRLGSAQMVGALNVVMPSLRFSNGASQPAALQPLGGDGGGAADTSWIPNLYLTWPLNPQWTLGLGVNAPFGAVSDYDEGWIGRFQGLKTDIKTINVNPAVSWKPMDNLALGFGLNVQRIEATFTSNSNYAGAYMTAAQASGLFTPAELGQLAAATAGLQTNTTLSGSDYGWGWNLGVLFDLTPTQRIGAQYRSAIDYKVSGNVSFANPTLPALPSGLAARAGAVAAGLNGSVLSNSGIGSDIKLPEIFNVSYFGSFNGRWELMADLQYTGWSSIQDLVFVRSDGSPLQSTVENFRSTWRVAVGGNYRLDEKWLLRAGVAWDQSPVRDGLRTVRLPDADRTWLAGGARYMINPKLWMDFGAAYVWVAGSTINEIGSSNLGQPPSQAASGLVNGSFNAHSVIVSGQLTWAF